MKRLSQETGPNGQISAEIKYLQYGNKQTRQILSALPGSKPTAITFNTHLRPDVNQDSKLLKR